MLESPDIFLFVEKWYQMYVTRMVTENNKEHIIELYFHVVWNSHNNKLGQNNLPIKKAKHKKQRIECELKGSYFLCSNFLSIK